MAVGGWCGSSPLKPVCFLFTTAVHTTPTVNRHVCRPLPGSASSTRRTALCLIASLCARLAPCSLVLLRMVAPCGSRGSKSTDLAWSEHGQAKHSASYTPTLRRWGTMPPHLHPRLPAVGRAWEQWWRVPSRPCSTPRARYQRDTPSLLWGEHRHLHSQASRISAGNNPSCLHSKSTATGASVTRRTATNPTAWQNGGVDS